MSSNTNEGLEFGPPRETASPRSFALALFVHLLLIGALTWGVNWKSTDRASTFEAELWSSVPQQAAPKLVEPPPPPPAPEPAPEPTPRPVPAPKPAPAPPEVKVAPPAPDVDIALQQEKKRKLLERQKEDAAEKAEKAQKLQDKRKAELQAKKELAIEKEKELEKEKAQKVKDDLAKRKTAEEAKKLEAKKQEAAARAEEKQAAAAEAAAKNQRAQNMKRIAGLAGATGGADAKGLDQKSSGPSAGYGGKVRAAVKPNVIFSDDVAGNPTAEIEVRTTLDGSIISQRLIKSSGNKAWDDAALKAVIRTGTLPRDTDGRVPNPLTLVMRPKD